MKVNVLLLVLFSGLTLAQDATEPAPPAEVYLSPFVLDNLMEEFRAMKEKLEETENQVLDLKNRDSIRVVFSAVATGDGDIGPFDTDIILNYAKILTNVGNHYNNATGIFAAPVAGIYYFSFFYHAGREHKAMLTLYKNDEVIVMSGDDYVYWEADDNGGNAMFLQLQQGDQVYVKLGAHSHVCQTLSF